MSLKYPAYKKHHLLQVSNALRQTHLYMTKHSEEGFRKQSNLTWAPSPSPISIRVTTASDFWAPHTPTPRSGVLEKLIVRSSNQEIHHILWNPEGALPRSQQLAIVPVRNHRKPVHTYNPISQRYILILILLCKPMSSKWLSGFLTKNVVCIYHSHACYMPHLYYPPWFDHHNSWRVHIMQVSQTSCHFINHISKYSPKKPLIKHPTSVFII
jgi:hypothetical protein